MRNLIERTKSFFTKSVVFAVVLSLALIGTVSVAGAIGTNPVENYIAAVKFNEGLYTTLPMTTTAGFTAASLITTGAMTVGTNLAVTGGSITGATTTVEAFTIGGGRTTLTPTSGSITLTEAQMLPNRIITFSSSTTMPALTVTFPATSTMTTLIPNTGDERSWRIENPFTAAATTTTIAAGTGIDLQEPDGQNVIIDPNNYAWITCIRGLDSGATEDVVCSVNETIPAD